MSGKTLRGGRKTWTALRDPRQSERHRHGIAFSLESDPEKRSHAPRIDLACFEEVEGKILLRFWEAKLYCNKEIRAEGDTPPRVLKQVAEYRKLLEAHRQEIVESYRTVACNSSGFPNGERTIRERPASW